MGAVVAVGAIPCAWIMRRQFGSNILTALAVTLVTVLLVTLILWFRPKTIGASALQVIMDFGRRFPFLARFCSALQKRAGGGTAP
jgi:hypothetical protein